MVAAVRCSAARSLVKLPMRFLAAGSAMLLALAPTHAMAQSSTQSIAGRRADWPSWEQLRSVLLLEDYNTRVVILGVAMLGIAAGLVGSFTLLRKRALMGDALAHASLPGITTAFMLATWLGLNGKSLPLLLVGATVGGLIGVGLIVVLKSQTRLKQDTALGIVLSVFFALGVAMMGLIQQMQTGSAAGLETFIYGKTASMTRADGLLIAVASLLAIGGCVALFKEFKLLCFDEDFAGSQAVPTRLLDMSLMALVVLVTIVGLQAVGLILMVALLVIPAAAARFWTEVMWQMAAIASLLGMLGGILGAGVSALFPRLPSGAMIVLVCAGLFLFSMIFGRSRGVLVRVLRRRRLNRRVHIDHLLRGMFESGETNGQVAPDEVRPWISMETLLHRRSWSRRELQRSIREANSEGWLRRDNGSVGLTAAGFSEAARLTRQHRLWELYLIHHADVAPSRVDRDADAIEHVLEPELVEELERLLEQAPVKITVPSSPH